MERKQCPGFFKRKSPNRNSFRKCRWRCCRFRPAVRKEDRRSPAHLTCFPLPPSPPAEPCSRAASLLCFTIWAFFTSGFSRELFRVTFPMNSTSPKCSSVIMLLISKSIWCRAPSRACLAEWGRFHRCCSFEVWDSSEFLKNICTFSPSFDDGFCTVLLLLSRRNRPLI